MASSIQQFLKEHGISEVEAIIPDMAGVARGKLMPAEKFAEEEGMRLPEAIFLQTVTGDYPDDQSAMNPSDIDIVLKADPKTVRVVPWPRNPPLKSFMIVFMATAGRSPWRRAMCCGGFSSSMKRRAGNRWWRRNSNSFWWNRTSIPTIP